MQQLDQHNVPISEKEYGTREELREKFIAAKTADYKARMLVQNEQGETDIVASVKRLDDFMKDNGQPHQGQKERQRRLKQAIKEELVK